MGHDGGSAMARTLRECMGQGKVVEKGQESERSEDDINWVW